ncbi:leucine-rich repeat and transmembrane domain-containing protein 2-like [Gadus macrocephalus]|uniref:leucine-rich repeat and transmembrane domain-containing protein 2-like n=1 Tax=Gadus macrocephalus TaxID=80720 RepID=UPI0028CB1C64|nr:leucine-rich repeat and transmembrane domain-containing protein 2-like [Gadus macrocephalus]XP_059916651.1 leucine-rich repeat and transmembrane domain-containing protein 2-like [Gadus macrocephalus]XP_059916652.1 leucine-rich repeat and transmembrane domain-containing protein 2-like [Gadus macrocephalus]XP_059916653.1 leucine-rich repeat and transmembrane domain-containing protein 2-like [Gadus macrocephalus]
MRNQRVERRPGGRASPIAGALLAALVLLALLGLAGGCPDVCSCEGNTTDCSGLGLVSLGAAAPLPPGTTGLSVAQNNLSWLGPAELANLSSSASLEVLDLSQNLLARLQPGLFLALGGLRWLNLSSNALGASTHLHPPRNTTEEPALMGWDGGSGSRGPGLTRASFQGLWRLRGLDLSDNGLAWLPAGLLGGLRGLVWLSLARNRLSVLGRAVLEPLGRLEQLQLSGNPWQCDCRLGGLRHWLDWMVYRGGQLDSLTCVLPLEVKGREVRSLPAEMFLRCLYDPSSPSSPSPRAPCPHRPHSGGEDCVRTRYRPASVRRAGATQAVAGVVCGTVCVMMVVAATYGCVYASLMARYQRGAKRRGKPLLLQGGATGMGAGPTVSLTSPEEEEQEEEEEEEDEEEEDGEAPPKEPCPVVPSYRISSF